MALLTIQKVRSQYHVQMDLVAGRAGERGIVGNEVALAVLEMLRRVAVAGEESQKSEDLPYHPCLIGLA